MRYAAVIKLLGILLMLFSLSMIPPQIVALIYNERAFDSFVFGFFLTLVIGFSMWLPFLKTNDELRPRDGFLVVVLFWVVLSLFGSIPLYLNLSTQVDFTETFFESVSGLTTTGATILTNLDQLPRSILYYRQQLHFLGGMGIIVLALAVMPMLGMGSGLRLYMAEATGPLKNDRLTPRLAETAKALWYIYVGIIVICTLIYWLLGMTIFDAVGEAFSTVSTGGFAMHDQSFAYYNSYAIDIVAMIFMIIGAISFTLHFSFIWHRDFKIYFKDAELRAYIKLIMIAILVTAFILYLHNFFPNHIGILWLHTAFTIISTATTTGFTISTTNFFSWPNFLPFLVMFLALIGGCGGSTAGGVKIIRVLLFKEQGQREMRKLIHPNSVSVIKLGNIALPESLVQSIWGFFAIYLLLFVILLLILLGTGIDPTTAFGALAACISNSGQSIGLAGSGYSLLPDPSKWVLIFAMIAGRLEIFTLVVLFMPSFWKK